MDYDFTQFRQNLRSLLDSTGKYAKDVAVDLGIAPNTISRYLLGGRNPDLDYVISMANYFSVSVDWLLGIAQEKTDKLSPNVQELIRLYSIASKDDRAVVDTVLEKYRGK